MRPFGVRALLWPVLTAALCGGCETSQAPLGPDCEPLRRENLRLNVRLEEMGEQLDEARRRIETLQGLDPNVARRVYTVRRIRLGSKSGGVDLDGNEGDEAVKVYVEPIDQHGSILKAAGSFDIRLFDLGAEDANAPLIGRRRYDPDAAAERWFSGFLAYHYSFTCPWDRPPSGDRVTVRVEFTDYLTGKTHAEQMVARLRR